MEGSVEVVRFRTSPTRSRASGRPRGSTRDPTDRKFDQAILHTDNKTEYKYIIGVIDAIYQTHRDMQLGPKTEKVPAFNITFAVN
jgi:hypothetical protein